jgi:hypothetical protein
MQMRQYFKIKPHPFTPTPVYHSLQQPSPNYMLQGHIKIVQGCNKNSEFQASEDSSELAAQQTSQRCTGDLE